jgi:hypothetical protein
MRADRLRTEVRLLGWPILGLPALAAAIYVGVAALSRWGTLRSGGTPAFAHFQAARVLLALLENGLPLAAGLSAALLVGLDPLLELHLALPAPYRGIVACRLALLLAWVLACTTAASTAITVAGYSQPPTARVHPSVLLQLTWLAPVLWFAAAGSALALAMRSRVASSAVLGMIWIAQFLLKDQFLQSPTLQKVYLFLTEEAGTPPYWLANRLLILAMAVALFGLVVPLLGQPEALLNAET